ncbi:LD-carboxypeptidase [Telmatospirillum sp.]|uniref:LD-carboxypeptidase n=1 Tax=Telmatospirillum sp. TaxID=2079197 RepID=UPI0028406E18|nr:LD-carboxypeptidase [Telmatospirillum sp.]MDR3435015.1 LD-carboxypeptidase [Telmatospirillum sp.]
MRNAIVRIGVVAPASRIAPDLALQVAAFARRLYPDRPPEIIFHPQCFRSHGHFAGDDACRAAAFVEMADDDSFDALWFARGGYGSCRLLDRICVSEPARRKTYLGYSDMGSLLAFLYKEGVTGAAHGPMPSDLNRPGGETAVARALAFLVEGAAASLEPTVSATTPTAAFNITILSHLIGTPFEPDLSGHVLMLEEVSEHMYRIDRALFHLTSAPSIRRVAGIKLGRCSDILANEPDFGQTEEDVVRHWCGVAGIAYLGRADIGHDVDNKVVPFGAWPRPGRPLDIF